MDLKNKGLPEFQKFEIGLKKETIKEKKSVKIDHYQKKDSSFLAFSFSFSFSTEKLEVEN